MYLMKENLFHFGVSFVMQKDSPYTLRLVDKDIHSNKSKTIGKKNTLLINRFSEKVDQLKQSGLIDHWIKTEQDKIARITYDGKTASLDLKKHFKQRNFTF